MGGHKNWNIIISHGVKQDCTLSPLIFNMALDHLQLQLGQVRR